ncbi:C-type lectin domain family 10 member A-like, partial [Salminus brasiliensis]|uniref:C-type lectin domain family 10 member A-like n=1 Tax=Salminus brasiliensis TaxID=930266 RepID=UPI003B834818
LVKRVLSCKSGWTLFGSRCYFFSRNELNWHEARDYCRAQNSFLLTVESKEELGLVLTKTFMAYYWVGLTDENTGQWRWDDGTPYTMNKNDWNPGQPDDWKNHGLGEEGEDCAHILENGRLNDAHCSIQHKYICKAKAE